MGIWGGREYAIYSRQCFEQRRQHASQDRSCLGTHVTGYHFLSITSSGGVRMQWGHLRGDPGGLEALIQSRILPCIPGSFGIMFVRQKELALVVCLKKPRNRNNDVLYVSFWTEDP